MPKIALTELNEAHYPWRCDHHRDIAAHFGARMLRPLAPDEQAFIADLDMFIVAFTNRSGSNLLTAGLNAAGLGIPAASEPFNRSTALPLVKEHDIPTFTDYVLGYLRGWERGGRVGFKAGPQQLFWLTTLGLFNDVKSIKILRCRRRDRLAQAVSLYIALHTGQWHSDMASGAPAPTYDRDALLECLYSVVDSERLLDLYLATHQLAALPVEFESLRADPAGVYRAIASFLDISIKAPDSQPLKSQASEANAALQRALRLDFSLAD